MMDTKNDQGNEKKENCTRQFAKKLMIAVNNKGQRMVLYFFAFALLFVLFGDAITDGKPQYSIAIASAFMGCIITVIITYILLNKQTENELDKERNAKIVEEKIKVYDAILTTIETVLTRAYPIKIAPNDMLRIQLINQKIIQIASEDVRNEFEKFWKMFSETFSGYDDISHEDEVNILKELSNVSWKIREDIDPSQKGKRVEVAKPSELAKQSNAVESLGLSVEQALDKIPKTPEESRYFDDLKQFVKDHSSEFTQSPGRVGFSIKKAGKRVVWYYPITATTPNNFIFHIENLSEEAKNILKESNAKLNMKQSPLKLADIPIERLKKLLEVA